MASADRHSELPELEVSQPSELSTEPVASANVPSNHISDNIIDYVPAASDSYIAASP